MVTRAVVGTHQNDSARYWLIKVREVYIFKRVHRHMAMNKQIESARWEVCAPFQHGRQETTVEIGDILPMRGSGTASAVESFFQYSSKLWCCRVIAD